MEQYVEFGVGSERYAVRIQDVNEIIKVQKITPLPNIDPFIKGVINLRGKLVPVVTIHSVFGFPEPEYSKSTRIMVIHYSDEAIGIVVDHVNKVTTYENIQSPPEQIKGVHGSFFSGIGVAESGLIGLLKLEQILLKN
ncbi:chemotaxis protein CheW [Paenibacillus thermotolerans]|uniref:chemotaxis protein CheW n=1 Tax=Paenibacillus thermotolerans TaxID=3027807 RepID=UPI0023687648|nr:MULTISPECIES: chemotaxis protein CheW [unclassified Paenibacillus]